MNVSSLSASSPRPSISTARRRWPFRLTEPHITVTIHSSYVPSSLSFPLSTPSPSATPSLESGVSTTPSGIITRTSMQSSDGSSAVTVPTTMWVCGSAPITESNMSSGSVSASGTQSTCTNITTSLPSSTSTAAAVEGVQIDTIVWAAAGLFAALF
ncbi:hypothetical protein NEOLEDRAFT_1242075 [Neolentinus lepideus HHB14362 ss-1]|uniref:Uncharacterized protein n=1 Tax=Neolentinus lepideus HHB14362 ss-1 TaxID=1314782 RepID=A0A165SD55_9AGAM|nr:hypothetical protein NEOLEDRAFT_1242075 [Neolentinus lepideus HHB14362 ss-1]